MNLTLISPILLALVLAGLSWPWARFFVAILQDNLYNDNHRYQKWLAKNRAPKIQNSLHFTWTFRATRIFSTTLLLIFATAAFLLWGETKLMIATNQIIFFVLIFVGAILTFFILTKISSFLVLLAYYFNLPLDKLLVKTYLQKAQAKLASRSDLIIIGITGSYGKTGTKNALKAILATHYQVCVSPENYNTPLGLAKTILEKLNDNTEVLIVEMGAYVPGEIQSLVNLVHPRYGILTAIGPVHMETFKTQEKITQTKFELITGLPKKGWGIINLDDQLQKDYLATHHRQIACHLLTIGLNNNQANFQAQKIKFNQQGSTFDCLFPDGHQLTLKTPLLAKASIYNLLSSIALAYQLGISDAELKTALKKIKPVAGRLELIHPEHQTPSVIINDTYNANPDSMKNALEALAALKTTGKKIAVLADMLELGDNSAQYHYEIGQAAAKQGIDSLVAIGPEAKQIQRGFGNSKRSSWCANNEEAIKILRPLVQKGDALLVKGSRSMRTEEIVDYFSSPLSDKALKK